MLPPAPRRWARLPPALLLLLPLLVRGAPTSNALDEDTEVVVPSLLPGGEDGELVVLLSGFGRNFSLTLKPDATFLAPEVTVELVGASYGAAEEVLQPRSCFYSGAVTGEPQSLAAVSVCHGLVGSFVLDGQEFTVQPREHGSSINRPHLLQRWGPPADPLEPGAEKGRQTREVPGDQCITLGHAGGQEAPSGRQKRFATHPRYVETALVADESMLQFYGANLQVRRAGAWGRPPPPGATHPGLAQTPRARRARPLFARCRLSGPPAPSLAPPGFGAQVRGSVLLLPALYRAPQIPSVPAWKGV